MPVGWPHAVLQLSPGGSDRVFAFEPEEDGVDVAGVGGHGDVCLQDRGAADGGRDRDCLVGCEAVARGGDRDAVRSQQVACLLKH